MLISGCASHTKPATSNISNERETAKVSILSVTTIVPILSIVTCSTGDAGTRPLNAEELECIGEPYAARILKIQNSDPVADALRKIDGGDYRFIEIVGAWSGRSNPGITCAFYVPRELLRGSLFFSDAYSGEGDGVERSFQSAYAKTFNATIADHSDYPYRDICRPRIGEVENEYWLSFLNLTEWKSRTTKAEAERTLTSATRLGHKELVAKLLMAGADPDEHDDWPFAPLGWAALRGDVDVVELLIEHNADPNLYCENCATPLHLAINSGSLEIVQRLIEAGADIEAESQSIRNTYLGSALPHSGPPLYTAIELSETQIATHLLQMGANPDKKGAGGRVSGFGRQAPAHLAILNKRLDLLKLLLGHGADPLARNGYGISLMQAAAAAGDAEAIIQLIHLGGLADARSAKERSFWAEASRQERHEILTDLVAFGENLNLLTFAEEEGLRTLIAGDQREEVWNLLGQLDQRAKALETAIKAGDLDKVRGFYGDGAEIAEGRKRTGLITAVDVRQHNIVEWYIEQGADPDAPLVYGNLEWLREGWVEAVGNVAGREIFEKPPQSTGPNPSGTAVTLVFERGPIKTVRLLMGKSKRDYLNNAPYLGLPLRRAIFEFRTHADPAIIDAALEFSGGMPKHGPEADFFLRELCYWVAKKRPDVLESYLQNGYRPRQINDPLPKKAAAYPGDNLALSQCIKNSPEAAILMLGFGADPNQVNRNGDTPLLAALDELHHDADGYLELLEVLLQGGANPDLTGIYDLVPLDYAQNFAQNAKGERGNRFGEAVEILRRFGAKSNAQLIDEGLLEPEPEYIPPIPVM